MTNAMKKRIAFIMVGMIVFLFSCAHRELKLPELASSATNASQVNIIREDRFFGFGFALTVMLDDAIICSLRAGEYVTFAVEPGIHTLGLSHAMAIMPFEAKKNTIFLSQLLMTNLDLRLKELMMKEGTTSSQNQRFLSKSVRIIKKGG